MISGRTPEEYRDLFADAFADLDGNPRATGLRFKADELEIDIVSGNPVFRVGDAECAADFRGRWLPEHPVPLSYRGKGTHQLRFVPTTGNRVKVS